MPQEAAIARWRSPHSYFKRRTSRILRMVNRSDIRTECRGDAADTRPNRCDRPSRRRRRAAVRRAQVRRNDCSSPPESVLKCSGTSAQVVRNPRSGPAGMTAQVLPESVLKSGRNTHLRGSSPAPLGAEGHCAEAKWRDAETALAEQGVAGEAGKGKGLSGLSHGRGLQGLGSADVDIRAPKSREVIRLPKPGDQRDWPCQRADSRSRGRAVRKLPKAFAQCCRR